MDIQRLKYKAQNHWDEYRDYYIGAIGVIGVAGITTVIMRDRISRGISVTENISRPIRHELLEPAKNELLVLGKKVVIKDSTLNNVSYILSQRQGPPSWVVRCIETGQLYTSQRSASVEMELPMSDISRHLNGLKDHVNGFHFERICMAA